MLFDSTLRKELARGFGATLVVILTIVITMMLIRVLGQAASGSVAPADVVLLMGYTVLSHLPTILALSLFISIVVTLGRMYRDSEMAIWFSSGVALTRFIAPVLRVSWPVQLVVAILVLVVWPWGNRSTNELRERYEQRSDLSRVTPGVFQTSRDGRSVFFIDKRSDEAMNARGVFVLSNGQRDESLTSARSAHLESIGNDRFLVLDSGQRNQLDRNSGERTLASFARYHVLVGERQVQSASTRAPKTIPTIDLLLDPSARNQGELVWRLGLLFGAVNLVLLAIGLAAINPRRATNWNLLFSLLGFVVYYNLINLSQAWVSGGRMALGPALAVVHGGALVLALSLMWWRDHAAVWRLFRVVRRARAAS
ncbi:MAG TPA: LPS export ABC transporter permease LptF [Burkholderiaceae bacterium]|jgi:lipopolysaccharide export system permease protein|nr:LPS export ABC transporter permease LptF [Burkholderiaceae bacterium]